MFEFSSAFLLLANPNWSCLLYWILTHTPWMGRLRLQLLTGPQELLVVATVTRMEIQIAIASATRNMRWEKRTATRLENNGNDSMPRGLCQGAIHIQAFAVVVIDFQEGAIKPEELVRPFMARVEICLIPNGGCRCIELLARNLGIEKHKGSNKHICAESKHSYRPSQYPWVCWVRMDSDRLANEQLHCVLSLWRALIWRTSPCVCRTTCPSTNSSSNQNRATIFRHFIFFNSALTSCHHWIYVILEKRKTQPAPDFSFKHFLANGWKNTNVHIPTLHMHMYAQHVCTDMYVNKQRTYTNKT